MANAGERIERMSRGRDGLHSRLDPKNHSSYGNDVNHKDSTKSSERKSSDDKNQGSTGKNDYRGQIFSGGSQNTEAREPLERKVQELQGHIRNHDERIEAAYDRRIQEYERHREVRRAHWAASRHFDETGLLHPDYNESRLEASEKRRDSAAQKHSEKAHRLERARHQLRMENVRIHNQLYNREPEDKRINDRGDRNSGSGKTKQPPRKPTTETQGRVWKLGK